VSNKPHTCPVCGGSGTNPVGGWSTSAIPMTVPCTACSGQGIVWGPEGSEKNWTMPEIAADLYPIINIPRIFPPLQDPHDLMPPPNKIQEIMEQLDEAIKKHKEENPKTLEEEILEIIKETCTKRIQL